MSLSLAPMCCCGGPGIARSFNWSAYLFTNHKYDWVEQPGGGWYVRLKRWPCWANKALPVGSYDGEWPAKPPTIYDAAHDYWVEGSIGYLPRTNEFVKGALLTPYGIAHGAHDAWPAVAAGRCDDCMYLSVQPTVQYPGGNIKARTLLTVGQGIDVYNALNLSTEGVAGFVGVDTIYLFGQVDWTTSNGTKHYRVFKVPHGGGSPITLEEYSVAANTSSGYTLPPRGMTVQASHTYISRQYFASGSTPKIRFLKDGGQFAEMSNSIGGGNGWAIGEVGGQTLAMSPPQYGASYGPSHLCIVEDGADTGTNAVRFATLDAFGATVELIPLSIGYDYQKRALCIVWGYPGSGFGSVLGVGAYATYHSEPLEPGNILAQHGVTVYELFSAGEMPEDQFFGFSGFGGTHGHGFGLGGSQSYCWHHVLSGRMPTPLVIESGHIVNPPPPPPPPPECFDLTTCPTPPPLSLSLSELDNFDVPFSSPPFGGTFHWLLQNWDGGYLLNDIGGGLYRIDLVATGNYATPGRLAGRLQDTNPNYQVERYLYAIVAHVVCTDGAVSIDYINFYMQEFIDVSGSPDLTFNGDGLVWQVQPPINVAPGKSLRCATTPIREQFLYDNPFVSTTTGPRDFYINAIIGAIE